MGSIKGEDKGRITAGKATMLSLMSGKGRGRVGEAGRIGKGEYVIKVACAPPQPFYAAR